MKYVKALLSVVLLLGVLLCIAGLAFPDVGSVPLRILLDAGPIVTVFGVVAANILLATQKWKQRADTTDGRHDATGRDL
ncbi:hypothetical protein G7Y31_02300 [Corynebacterium lizhenjunii]|uniref:Uncharacterized protein n=1 Tax=Corynebacterium lizhenjunii TaxID=2709394 RepID=A0A7T0KGX9_9CORY|nr:hypothetical protein [Corynebacterium lizhenjunii]QPK79563.1 hypothetical protein G7Y31_02300 [Corynebacterium lizhenjunii]